MEKGNLISFLREGEGRSLNTSEVIDIAKQVSYTKQMSVITKILDINRMLL